MKKDLKRFWKFLWEDDSILSWCVNLLLAFIVIKFVIYPVLGLLFATNFPVVAVVSGSMEHGFTPRAEFDDQVIYTYCSNKIQKQSSSINLKDYGSFNEFWDNCGEWYSRYNITKDQFRDFSFTNGFNKGDVMVLHGTKPEKIKVGDVIVFIGKSRPDPIIHRVVSSELRSDGMHFVTKGDHNEDSFSQIGEDDITEDMYLAKAVLKIPYLGWVKIWFSYVVNGFRPIS